MGREFARWNVAAHIDDDWRNLPALAQWLYWTIWNHPKLNYAGVLDWRPVRISATAAGIDPATVEALARCLEARLFIVVDPETEELLLRSWVRWDGLMRQPRMAVSFAKAFAEVESNMIRGVLVHQVARIREKEPDLAGWAKPAVSELLARPGIDPRSRALPADPFRDGLGSGFPTGLGPVSDPVSVPFGPNASQRLGPVSLPPTPTPSPTTAPYSLLPALANGLPPNEPAETTSEGPPPKGKEMPLPDTWAPTSTHIQYAKDHDIDLMAEVESFRNHAHTHDRRAVRWNAAFTQWLNKAAKWQSNRARPANNAGATAKYQGWADLATTYADHTTPQIGDGR